MAEYKCGDCFYADLCEESEILDGFNRDNPAYCSLFLNSADVAPVRHGEWEIVVGSNGNDEWLPMVCDFGQTVCPNVYGGACWEQYLKHYGERKEGAD